MSYRHPRFVEEDRILPVLQKFIKDARKLSFNRDARSFLEMNRESIAFMEMMGMGIYLYDYANNRYHYLSDRVFEILHINREDLKKKGIVAFYNSIHENDRDRIVFLVAEGVQYVNGLSDALKAKTNVRQFYRVKVHSEPEVWVMQSNRVCCFNNGWFDIGTVHLLAKDRVVPPLYMTIQSGPLLHCILPPGHTSGQLVLSPREEEVFFWSRRGTRVKEIARHLNITEEGVRFHRKNILRKLGRSSFTGV